MATIHNCAERPSTAKLVFDVVGDPLPGLGREELLRAPGHLVVEYPGGLLVFGEHRAETNDVGRAPQDVAALLVGQPEPFRQRLKWIVGQSSRIAEDVERKVGEYRGVDVHIGGEVDPIAFGPAADRREFGSVRSQLSRLVDIQSGGQRVAFAGQAFDPGFDEIEVEHHLAAATVEVVERYRELRAVIADAGRLRECAVLIEYLGEAGQRRFVLPQRIEGAFDLSQRPDPAIQRYVLDLLGRHPEPGGHVRADGGYAGRNGGDRFADRNHR